MIALTLSRVPTTVPTALATISVVPFSLLRKASIILAFIFLGWMNSEKGVINYKHIYIYIHCITHKLNETHIYTRINEHTYTHA